MTSNAKRAPRFSLYSREVSTPAPNPLAKHFGPAIALAFAEDILPPKKRSHFDTDDAPLYVTERVWPIEERLRREETAPDPFRLEKTLDTYFWAKDAPRLLFVEGPVGSGKSTLVDYYLRCYCPSLGDQKEEFPAKLVVSVDFRSCPTPAEFDVQLNKRMREAIQDRCDSVNFPIELASNYAMYESIFEFSTARMRAAWGATDKPEFRKRFVGEHGHQVTDERWINGALRFLTTRPTDSPFKYLVLCLDNLDQSESDVWSHAVWRVRRWLEESSEVDLWRVIIPLRPTTFLELEEKHAPLPNYEPLTIAPPDLEQLFKSRDVIVRDAITSTPDEMASQFGDTTKEFLLSFVSDCRHWASKRFHDLLNALAGGSTRQVLNLWRSTIASQSLFGAYKHKSKNPSISQYIGFYFLVEGMLRGAYSLYNPDKHSIPNIWSLGEQTAGDHRDLLVGPHTLSLLESNPDVTMAHVRRQLAALGYSQATVEKSLLTLKHLRVYRTLSQDRIHVEMSVVKAFLDFICNPAYVDNVAPITPINTDLHDKISFVPAGSPDEFVNRSLNGLTFLFQVRQDELEFCKGPQQTGSGEHEVFKASMENNVISSYYKRAALNYKRRLSYLKGAGFYRSVSPLDWDSLLHHDAFTGLDEYSDILLPYMTSA